MRGQLAVNGRFFLRRVSGVERYAREILRCLPVETRMICPKKKLNGLAGHLWEQVSLPVHLKDNELLWSPANSGPLAISHQVVSIHDTLAIDHPEWFRPSFAVWYRIMLPLLARRVLKVLTVSEYSKGRIIEAFRLPPEKVVSIPNGVSLERFHPSTSNEVDAVRTKYALPADYLLYLGSIEPRKNLIRLLQAWRNIQAKFPQFNLVIAGGIAQVTQQRNIKETFINVRSIGYVDDHDLPALYSGATAFLYPSLSEGFGLQVLEAMACGVPVMAARAGALPEVVGKSGLLVNPLNISEMEVVIARLIEDRSLRKDLVNAGLDRVKAFAWEVTAEKVAAELRKAQSE
jgi:glycosyltransferase involved in cell wall biosynthesis